jgi:uncharacterized protein
MTINTYFTSIYTRMVLALIVSAATAWLTVNSALIYLLGNSIFFFGLIAVQLGLLFGVQAGINKLSQGTASALFLAYSAINGVLMSGFLLHYLTHSFNLVLVIFGVAISLFAALSVLGYTTKHDMSGMKTFLFAAMWGIFFSSLANWFLQNSLFDTIISAAALLVFSALTVYDVQYFKNLHASLDTPESHGKAITLGALHMYINFIMIFQNLLNLAGKNE